MEPPTTTLVPIKTIIPFGGALVSPRSPHLYGSDSSSGYDFQSESAPALRQSRRLAKEARDAERARSRPSRHRGECSGVKNELMKRLREAAS